MVFVPYHLIAFQQYSATHPGRLESFLLTNFHPFLPGVEIFFSVSYVLHGRIQSKKDWSTVNETRSLIRRNLMVKKVAVTNVLRRLNSTEQYQHHRSFFFFFFFWEANYENNISIEVTPFILCEIWLNQMFSVELWI